MPLLIEDQVPFRLIEAEVKPDWVNSLGHLRAAHYVQIFDDAFMAMFPGLGLTDARLMCGSTSPVLADLHATYLAELRTGDRVSVAAQFLDADERRVRLILLMHALGVARLAATCELAIVNMDLTSRRPAQWSTEQTTILDRLKRAHASLPMPKQAGRSIGPLTLAVR
ncbi:MAG TPA: thioesterase family protein [Hyphomicrobiaceae bacterium]|nr:thioesterase family protein [Hyphomicrobiaceae bacterium]